MVNFGAPATVPEPFAGRLFYEHNPQVTLMRTTVAENVEIGRFLAGKLNASIECNPLLGPQLMAAVKDVVAGKPIPRRVVTEEAVFTAANAREAYPARKY